MKSWSILNSGIKYIELQDMAERLLSKLQPVISVISAVTIPAVYVCVHGFKLIDPVAWLSKTSLVSALCLILSVSTCIIKQPSPPLDQHHIWDNQPPAGHTHPRACWCSAGCALKWPYWAAASVLPAGHRKGPLHLL